MLVAVGAAEGEFMLYAFRVYRLADLARAVGVGIVAGAEVGVF